MHRKMMVIVLFIGIGLSFQGCENAASVSEIKNEAPKEKVSQSSSDTQITEKNKPQTVDKQANVGAKTSPKGPFKTFYVYSDGMARGNHYIPSGWMGDYGDIKIDEKYTTNPHSGTSCFKVVYNGKAAQGARWAGIFWQNPPNNWGTRPGGYDLTGAKKATFWARGDKGGERIEEFKVGGITGEYADSDVAGIGPVVLTPEWQEFTIDLEGKDLSSISGGFCWATNVDVNPDGCTFYLDEIKYE